MKIINLIINEDETRWLLNSLTHRDNDLPAIIQGEECFYMCANKVHRDKGPAAIYINSIQFWKHGKYIAAAGRTKK